MTAALILTVSGCGTRNGSSLSGQDAGNDQNGTTDREEPVFRGGYCRAGSFHSGRPRAFRPGRRNDSVLPDTGAPAVYMTTDMSAEGLMAVYEALDASPSGNIAVNLFVSFP